MKKQQTPEEVLRRVLRMARFNGLSVVIIALLGAIVSLALGDLVGTFVGLLVAIGGFMELSGRERLVRGDIAGIDRLVRAQQVVLGAILVYCVTRLVSFDAESVMGNTTPEIRSAIAEVGVDMSVILPLVRLVFMATYTVVIVLTLIYQGLMIRYYRRRTEPIKAALAARLRPSLIPVMRPGSAPEDLVT